MLFFQNLGVDLQEYVKNDNSERAKYFLTNDIEVTLVFVLVGFGQAQLTVQFL